MNNLVKGGNEGGAIATPGRLSAEAAGYARQALSPSTLRNYRAQVKLWLAWCDQSGITALPADPVAAANWLAHRAAEGAAGGRRRTKGAANKTGQSPSSLRVAVAAIKAAHRAAGHDFQSDHPAVAQVLRGIVRAKGEAPAQVAPMRAGMILDILRGLGITPIEVRDASILAVGYCFGRRRSEIVGLDLDRLGDGDGWLERDAKTLAVHLVRHKTSDGQVKPFVIPRAPNKIAVQAIERWITMANIEQGTALFRRIRHGGNIGIERLSDQTVARIIKSRIACHLISNGTPEPIAREEAARYAGHSLRVGLAVTSAEAGADLRVIQSALGHATPAMAAKYAAAAEAERNSVHHRVGVGLGDE